MANIQDLLGEKYHEGMTVEEINEALKDVSLPQDRTAEYESLKKAYDKAASDTAEYKRQLKARMSEEEKAKTEMDEKIQKMEKENADMKKRIAVSELTAKFISSGLDADEAVKVAEQAYGGNIDFVIEAYNKKIATVKETVKADLMAETPSITGGASGQVKDISPDIDSTIAVGDYANAAALMRQAQTQNTNI